MVIVLWPLCLLPGGLIFKDDPLNGIYPPPGLCSYVVNQYFLCPITRP